MHPLSELARCSAYLILFYQMETAHKAIVQSAADTLDLESESIDLVVTSPPYPMIEIWDGAFGAQEEGIAKCLECGDGPGAFELMHAILDTVWRECYREQ